MAQFRCHMFVCIHDRGEDAGRASCARRGSAEVAAMLKEKAYEAGLKRIVRVNKAGCLDQCERGTTVVVYPEATWYGGVRPEDVDELVSEHLIGGRTVDRLVIPDGELTGRGSLGGEAEEGGR